eukprot:TRINITY_DN9013_c0_g1_i1.p1 TRINITY_DN9013_c0_g1~~TRINITY_DN9013_c0_g1_i1.p1  ORF type:complete len:439 (-),score=51.20 TRINITY_DN9013_c0_g1_i1:51-1367(-)
METQFPGQQEPWKENLLDESGSEDLGSSSSDREQPKNQTAKIFRSGSPMPGAEESGKWKRRSGYLGGDVASFGYNFFGQLGDGNTITSAVPRHIDLKSIVQVSCGEAHSIAISSNGLAYGWGCNRYGQLGLGDTTSRSTPTLIEAVKSVKMKNSACGLQHTALLTYTGEIHTFGCGSFGRLGLGDHKHQLFPVVVAALRGKFILQVSCGGWFTAAVGNTGNLFTWGCNRFGNLAQGKTPVQLLPRSVSSLFGKNVIRVECGKNHTLVQTDLGELLCFGAGGQGQLGNGARKNQFYPVPVMDVPRATLQSFACGYSHSLALTTDGKLYMWGYISADHLGLSENGEEYVSQPIILDTKHIAKKIVEIFAGGHHSALVTEDGELFTWGFGYAGRLGYDTTPHENRDDLESPITPTKVVDLSSRFANSIACGGAHSLVVNTS